MKYTVLDIEADGLLPTVSKIHCLSYEVYDSKTLLYQGTITDYNEMKNFVLNQETIAGHNMIDYDIPVLEKLLGIKNVARLIDTLGLSWYLSPIHGFRHGLESWGERFGIPKPVVEDWENQPIEVYINRCEEDVKINSMLMHEIMDYLMEIYGSFDKVDRAIRYNTFKMECLKEQREKGITLDQRLAEESKMNLEFELEERMSKLSALMPKQVDKEAPKRMYKKDGSLSSYGVKWQQLLEERGQPLDSKVLYKPGNPGSNKQLKEWLFQLGWEPQTFKTSKATKEEIPQVSLPFGGGLCPSVLELIEKKPELKELEGLFMVRHRVGLFKSFLENMDDNGKIYSRAQGFTNTYRLQHSKPIANLPGVDKYYGKEIRGCIKVTDDSYTMIGSDISGLEDNTKQHYMYFHDPKYVEEMRVEGFDPHIDIAIFANLMSEEQADRYKELNAKENLTDDEKTEYKSLKKIRANAKTVNFGGVYGIGAPKLAKQLNISLAEAEKLHTGYWKRNAAVKKIANECKTKTVRGQKWLYNPVSQLWMFLKEDKDKFSTLNQSSGVYVFDTWMKFVRRRLNPLGIKMLLQYHDELLFECPNELTNLCDMHLKEAMKEANQELQLNVEIEIDTQFGKTYADCH
jgi:hypothetical protein